MENSSEWIHNEWQSIDARAEKAAKDLAEASRRLDALMTDIEFWNIVFDSEEEAAE